MLDEVLAEVDAWPVDTIAVGVTTAADVLGTHGPVDEVLRLASVTKPLAAYTTLVAIQHGYLHLDEPAGPEGSTVRHLLAHASGLWFDGEGPTGRPGAHRVYSNLGFEALGRLVAQRVGVSFADHFALEVTEPLGMASTRLDGSPAHAAHGTVADLLTFARELLAPTLIDPELMREARTVQFPGLVGVLPGFGRQDPNDWGLGFELRDDKSPHWTGPGQSPATFGHFGQSGSFLWVDPDAEVACAFLADRDFGGWSAKRWPPFNQAVWEATTGR
jgi:CubicO group peptidase (beta-lactamase class C family)